MRYLSMTISLVVWIITTLLLALSIVGLVVLVREDYTCETYKGEQGESSWIKLGKTLIDNLVE